MKGVCATLAAIVLFAFSAHAQLAELENGFRPTDTYQALDFDAVNLSNGNLILNIPIISYPQRGSMPDFRLKIGYNNKSWEIVDHPPNSKIWNFSGKGVELAVEPYLAWQGLETYVNDDPDYPIFWDFAVDSSGARHLLGRLYDGSTPIGLASVNQTGIRLNDLGLIDNRGIRHGGGCISYKGNPCVQNSWVKDPSGNGNVNSITANSTTWTDTIGRQIPIPDALKFHQYHDSYSTETLYFSGISGGTVPITFTYSTINVASFFDLESQGVWDYIGTISTLTKVTLPNEREWKFFYNPWGDLSSVTTPAGGSIVYTWQTVELQGPLRYERRIATRTVYPTIGGSGHTWTYSYAGTNMDETTVIDPAGNKTIYKGDTRIEYYSGLSTLLKVIDKELVITTPFFWAPGWDKQPFVVKKITTTWELGLNDQVAVLCSVHDSIVVAGGGCLNPGGSIDSNAPKFYDPYGIQRPLVYGSELSRYEYDYGTNAPGTLLRKTETAYMWRQDNDFLTANLMDRVASVTIRDGSGTLAAQTTYGYDASGCSSSACGLQTSVTRENGTTDPVTTTTYNSQGMPTQVTDPGGHDTYYAYDATGMFVSQITNHLGHVQQFSYDTNTGLLNWQKDPNDVATGRNGTVYTYDSMRRITNISYPDGGSTAWNYHNDPQPPVITRTIEADPDPDQVLITRFDSLGRVIQTEQSDPEGDDYIDTSILYDSNAHERIACTSNPHRSAAAPTDGQTCTHYDALGRVKDIVRQDGGNVHTDYAGSCSTVTDEAGHKRKNCTDALGRLTGVWEDPDGVNYETDYTYNARGDLTDVNQKGDNSAPRTRHFNYDSLSRLTAANNPESGTVSYTYDADSNVLSKVTPQANQTNPSVTTTLSYCYDSLHRIIGKAHTAQSCPLTNPAATYTYDQGTNGIGRRTLMTDSSGQTSWTYDSLGRILSSPKTIAGVTRTFSYAYDLAGQNTSIVYPTGAGTIAYVYSSVTCSPVSEQS